MVSARALHYVLKIGDRGANINFFRNILGMQVISYANLYEYLCTDHEIMSKYTMQRVLLMFNAI